MSPFQNTSEISSLRELIHESEYNEYNFYFQNAKSFLNKKEYSLALESVDEGLTKDPDNLNLLILKAKILLFSNHNLQAENIKKNFHEALGIIDLCDVMIKNKYSELLNAKDTSLISEEDFLNYFNDNIKLNGLKEAYKIYSKHFEIKI